VEDGAELASVARSLGLAKIFVFTDEELQRENDPASGPASRVQQRYVTALSIARACDLAEERLQRARIDVERTDQTESCGLEFILRSYRRHLVRGGFPYHGCIVVQNGQAGTERDVYLTVNTAPIGRSCSTRGFAHGEDDAETLAEPERTAPS
jgi:hypothetical protein